MRILQVANFVHSTSGGMGRALESLAREYRRMNHDVRTIVPSEETAIHPETERWTVRGTPVPKLAPYRVIIGRRELKEMVAGFAPDIVELSDKTTLVWLAKWCATRGIRVHAISHERTDIAVRQGGVAAQLVRPYLKWNRRQLSNWADLVVCASSFAAEEFPGASNVSVVPLGVDTELFRPDRARASWGSPLRLVVCSRLSPEKNVATAIEALRILCADGNHTMTVMGDGPLRDELEALAGSLPVEFVGLVNDRDSVAHTLRHADVVLNLGSQETFGLVTLEAMASGTPVVVADSGGSRELLGHGCGLAVPVDPSVVADAVLAIRSWDRASTLERCRDEAVQYGWDRTARALLGHGAGQSADAA